ncbi:MAG: hypothetical protein AB1714_16300 [Acidobacteriota bacterium]
MDEPAPFRCAICSEEASLEYPIHRESERAEYLCQACGPGYKSILAETRQSVRPSDHPLVAFAAEVVAIVIARNRFGKTGRLDVPCAFD